MITLKDLVVGITHDFQFFIDKSFVNTVRDWHETNLRMQVGKNAAQPFQLAGLFGKNEDAIACTFMGFEIFDQQVKLPVECGLRPGLEFYFFYCKMWFVAEFNKMSRLQFLFNHITFYKFLPG